MPIYEYDCPKCGTFDVIQKASEKPLKKNPDCPHADCPGKAERKISASAFHLKGGGWYKTDYASSNSQAGKKSGGSDSSSTATDSTKISEAKPSETKTAAGETAPTGKKCKTGCGCH